MRGPENSLPDKADVVVIGGGIAGCSAALYLAQAGISVVLCEKGRIAGEQSSRNWGWVRLQGRDRREVPLMLESRRLWRAIAEASSDATGFKQAGCLYLATNETELAAHAQWLETAREFSIDTKVVAGAKLETLLPGNAHRFAGALYTASDCRAEPAMATPVIAALARQAGASIHTQCAVRGLDVAAGKVCAVVTEHGVIHTSCVICAGGVWTARFCASLGVQVPQLTARGSVFRTAPAPNVLDGTAWSKPVALRRRTDGGYTVAHGYAVEHFVTSRSFRNFRKFLPQLLGDYGQIRMRLDGSVFRELAESRVWPLDRPTIFETTRILDPPPSRTILAEAKANLARYFPQLANVTVEESWGGTIEASPDVIPILSDAPSLPGLFVATGFSGHGFGIGPGAGKAIADMARGATPAIDMAPFRLQRFYDGSPIVPGPGL